MLSNNYECEGQIDFKTIELPDYTYDRNGNKQTPPQWLKKERCENCIRWARYITNEQPPAGHGLYGWCNEYNAKCEKFSYCQRFEKNYFGI